MRTIDNLLDKTQILNRYRKICGKKIIDELCAKAKKFADKHIVFITSTYQGGDVAER